MHGRVSNLIVRAYKVQTARLTLDKQCRSTDLDKISYAKFNKCTD